LAGGFGGCAANLVDLRDGGGGDGFLRAPGPAFHAGFAGDLFGAGILLPPFGCEGPGVAFLAGDPPRGADLLWLLDSAGVAFRVRDLPREGALLALWSLPRVGEFGGGLLPDLRGLAFRAGGLPREDGGALFALRPGPAFHAGFGDAERPEDETAELERLNDLAPRPL